MTGAGLRARLARAVGVLAVLGCLLPGMGSAGERIRVFVSILPQKFFAESVGGDRVDVSVMVGPGQSPATYAPRPAQLAALAEARLYFAVGVPFEQAWMRRIRAAAPDLVVVETQQGIRLRPMDVPPGMERSEPRQGGRRDPHVWLSPALVAHQARRMAQGLTREDPRGAAVYRERLRRFEERLKALDRDLRAILAPVRGARFLVFHPSWGYFADAYGLRQVPVEVDGKPPRARTLARLASWARKERVGVLVVGPRLRRGTVEMLARAFRARVVVADPVAEDWEGELRRFAANLAAALQDAGSAEGRAPSR